MKVTTILLLAFAIGVKSSVLPSHEKESRVADNAFVHDQLQRFELLFHMYETDVTRDQSNAAHDFDFNTHHADFTNGEAVTKFQKLYQHGFLPQGAIFSIFNDRHRTQAIALFKVFYYAKDWDTLFKVASWARRHINEGLFVYSFSVAVVHRPDLKGAFLPSPYEVNPYYFVDSETFTKALRIKLQRGLHSVLPQGVEFHDNVFSFIKNSSSSNVRYNHEQIISYFTEDPDLHAYSLRAHYEYPFWLGGDEFGLKNDRRGEHMTYMYFQLYARYYLERLSNGLGEIPNLSVDKPIKTGFHNDLKYANGVSFPSRPNYYYINTDTNVRKVNSVMEINRRLSDALYKGYIELPNNQKVSLRKPEDYVNLANYIIGHPDSGYDFHSYYIPSLKAIFGGGVPQKHDYLIVPSALEHFETALRDPVAWQLMKQVHKNLMAFKHSLPGYKREELSFPGVKLINVQLDRLVTFWDKKDIEFTQGVFLNDEERKNGKDNFVFVSRQKSLNHKHFSIKMEVSTKQDVKGVVRIFLGPQYDSYKEILTLTENHENFFEIDTFLYDLKTGINIIERSCEDFNNVAQEKPSGRVIYQNMKAHIKENHVFKLNRTLIENKLPLNLLLPKGSKGGFPVQLFVIVSPYVAPKQEYGTGFDPVISNGIGTGARYLDGRAFGYPFDRIVDADLFYDSNMFWKNVSIYHTDTIESEEPRPNTTTNNN